jgi:hypothetical protein
MPPQTLRILSPHMIHIRTRVSERQVARFYYYSEHSKLTIIYANPIRRGERQPLFRKDSTPHLIMPALQMLMILGKPGKTRSKLVRDIGAVSPINLATGNRLQPLPRPPTSYPPQPLSIFSAILLLKRHQRNSSVISRPFQAVSTIWTKGVGRT